MHDAPSSVSRPIEIEIEAVFRLYVGLCRFMSGDGLGGKLLYSGAPDASGCHLLRAANIAGAASLAASLEAGTLREAMRAGAIDFVVNSLDEALRILKNEIRKQQPVAVGVSLAPESLLQEMEQRGVLPDLLAPDLPKSAVMDSFTARGARRIEPLGSSSGKLNMVPIPQGWSQPAAAFDALLLECLAPEDELNRRWVRFAPRYLPSEARRLRSIACDVERLRRLDALIANQRSLSSGH